MVNNHIQSGATIQNTMMATVGLVQAVYAQEKVYPKCWNMLNPKSEPTSNEDAIANQKRWVCLEMLTIDVVYVCMCILYIYIYLLSPFMPTYVFKCIYLYLSIYLSIYLYIYIYIYICMYIYMYIHMHKRAHISTCTVSAIYLHHWLVTCA